jgi:hypothetical protein
MLSPLEIPDGLPRAGQSVILDRGLAFRREQARGAGNAPFMPPDAPVDVARQARTCQGSRELVAEKLCKCKPFGASKTAFA